MYGTVVQSRNGAYANACRESHIRVNLHEKLNSGMLLILFSSLFQLRE